MPIRVLHVIDSFNQSSGVSSVVMNFYNHLDHNKVTFDFIVHDDTPLAYRKVIEERGSKIYQMPKLKYKNVIFYYNCLKAFFTEHPEYQIIHGHIANAALFYLGMAKRFKVPYRIIHSHNSSGADNRIKRIRNYFLNLPIKWVANHYMACSDKAASFLFGSRLIKENKVLKLPNAIEIRNYIYNDSTRQLIRRRLELNDKLVIGHVGRFCKQKNHSFLVDIFKEVHQRNANAVLILIGTGEDETAIKDKVQKLKLSNAIFFLGARTDVNELMQGMDIFVLPSLFEGLPVVGIEAQASNLKCFFSSTISSEAAVTDRVEFINLSCSPKEWGERILNFDYKYQRDQPQNHLIDSEFDIYNEVKILEQYYTGLLTKRDVAV